MNQIKLFEHLDKIYDLTGRPFYKDIKKDIINENYLELLTFDITFLIDAYFNDGFRHINWQEVKMIMPVLDILESCLVSELLTETDKDSLVEYAQSSKRFNKYRKNQDLYLLGGIKFNEKNNKWGNAVNIVPIRSGITSIRGMQKM